MSRSLFALALVLIALAGCQPSPGVDSSRLAATVETLSSEDFQGRLLGSPGGAAARAWLLEQALEAGLEPVDGIGNAPFIIDAWDLDSREVALSRHGDSYGTALLAARGPFSRGMGQPLAWDGQTPPDSPYVHLFVHRYLPGRLGSPLELRDRAAGQGAGSLLLLPHPEDASGMFQRYRKRAASGMTLHGHYGALEIPLLYGDGALGEALLARPEARWEWTFPHIHTRSLVGQNLVLDLPGGQGPLLLLTAHYDHLGPAEEGWYPGADDNGSGVAVLLELARVLRGAELPFRLRFLFSDGEEEGWLGAQSYLSVCERPDRVINLDTVGRGGVDHYRKLRDPDAADERLLILWSGEEDALHQSLLMAGLEAGFHARSGQGPVFALAGDHHPFHRDGVPAHFIFGGFYSDYHGTGDLPRKVLPSRLEDLCLALEGFLRNLDPAAIAPASR